MSSLNLFSWIREGVRQSVLLGVSDAVEQLGTPASTDELHPSVAGFLNAERSTKSLSHSPTTTSGGSTSSGRKRLGKSLKEID
ncbi:MAG: hypothetical protein KDB22_10990 [Planctomycetales bacterium]|nr:hypothetical protein [Planctomycetales bacterium]